MEISKWGPIKLTSFCTAKETTNKVKRQPSEWEKIAKETTGKDSIYKIYKQFIQLNTRKTNNPIKRGGKNLSRHFSREDIQIANKHMKRCSTLLIIRQIQTKTTRDITSHYSELPLSKSLQTITAGDDVEKR